jgi:hypothetical protein
VQVEAVSGPNVFPFHRDFRELRFRFGAQGRAAEAINRVAQSYFYPIEVANDRDHIRW